MQRFIPTTEEEKEQVFSEIEKVAAILARISDNSRFFGQFIYDVLVPKLELKTPVSAIDDIDIYQYNMNFASKEFISSGLKHVSGSHYRLEKFGSVIANFHFSSEVSYRYNIDYLYLYFQINRGRWDYGLFHGSNSSSLVNDIKIRHVRVLDAESALIRNGDKEACQRLLDKFLSKGWTVELKSDPKYKIRTVQGSAMIMEQLIALVTEEVKESKLTSDLDALLTRLEGAEASFDNMKSEITKIKEEVQRIKIKSSNN